MHAGVQCFIGNGVVVSPEALVKEIKELESIGVEVRSRLKISEVCPLIMPYHIAIDQARELKKVKIKSVLLDVVSVLVMKIKLPVAQFEYKIYLMMKYLKLN